MRKLLFVCALAALTSSSWGCCRMCCWQRGGSYYNGYCYPAMPAPALQPAPAAQPQQTYAQPCICQ